MEPPRSRVQDGDRDHLALPFRWHEHQETKSAPPGVLERALFSAMARELGPQCTWGESQPQGEEP